MILMQILDELLLNIYLVWYYERPRDIFKLIQKRSERNTNLFWVKK